MRGERYDDDDDGMCATPLRAWTLNTNLHCSHIQRQSQESHSACGTMHDPFPKKNGTLHLESLKPFRASLTFRGPTTDP